MKLSKQFRCRFEADTLITAEGVLFADLAPGVQVQGDLSVWLPEGQWSHDSVSDFYADYRRADGRVSFSRFRTDSDRRLAVMVDYDGSHVAVAAEARHVISSVMNCFDAAEPTATRVVAAAIKPRVFIGHGGSDAWRDLKDHLHDKHDIEVVAYEIGARAGHTIRDILADMLRSSSFALLVMTGDDETAGATMRARQNVVHETGLFQGHLGFNRAVVLLEENVEEFSNLQGVQQIRFARGRIRETFGDVLATIKREFPHYH